MIVKGNLIIHDQVGHIGLRPPRLIRPDIKGEVISMASNLVNIGGGLTAATRGNGVALYCYYIIVHAAGEQVISKILS